MAHTQKPDFAFHRNRWVHLNRRGHQFSWMLAAEVCASALVMLDTPHFEVVWEYWLPTPSTNFPLTSPPVRHRVPSGFKRTLKLCTSLTSRVERQREQSLLWCSNWDEWTCTTNWYGQNEQNMPNFNSKTLKEEDNNEKDSSEIGYLNLIQP